jgi:hypothetical protein
MGCKEVESNSRKYRTFERPSGSAVDTFYFVGKKGALRVGRCASKSCSVEQVVPAMLKRWLMQ